MDSGSHSLRLATATLLSLAWLYKDQYADAGFRMLPVVRGGPNLTVEVTLLTTLL